MNLKVHLLFVFGVSLVWVSTVPQANGAKILAVYSFPGKSHTMMHGALMRELIGRGHQVTMITAFTYKHLNLGANFTEVLIEPVYDFWEDIKQFFAADNLFELTSMDVTGFLKMLEILGTKTTEHALKQPKVKEIINARKTEGVYDLLLVEQFYQEPFLALAHIYNVPVVSTSTLGFENHMSQMMGVLTPWSFVPHGFLAYTDHMNFWQRLVNSYYSLYEDLQRDFIYFPQMDQMVEEHFGNLTVKIPKVREMERNISLMLLNSYVPLATPRPVPNAMIPVGGMHIYPPKALPPNMQKFLDDATDGAIFFSLGSNVQSKDMPADRLKMFLEVFGSLKQRVLWKFENENISDLPPNVMVKKWLPQTDILAHRNVKVFITHGGLFSTQEGVHYAVPLLGIPFYCDQHLNLNKGVLGGYAISLHFQSITHDILRHALLELIENPKYKNNINHYSQIFRDRPMGARETAIYWIEYVINYRGAPQIRSAGLDLAWYEFYLLDVIAFVVGGILLTVMILVVLWRLIFKSRRDQKQEKID